MRAGSDRFDGGSGREGGCRYAGRVALGCGEARVGLLWRDVRGGKRGVRGRRGGEEAGWEKGAEMFGAVLLP